MKTYVRVRDGYIFEVIEPFINADGDEVPIADRFTPEFVALLVDVTSLSPQPQPGWAATENGGTWQFSQS